MRIFTEAYDVSIDDIQQTEAKGVYIVDGSIVPSELQVIDIDIEGLPLDGTYQYNKTNGVITIWSKAPCTVDSVITVYLQ